MESHNFGKYKIEYDPDNDRPVTLYDETGEWIDKWEDLFDARMDIDYSFVGTEITLEQWQGLWDWIDWMDEQLK